MSRDMAVGPSDAFGRPSRGERCSGVTQLLTSLFRDQARIVASHGWLCKPGQTSQLSCLGDTFKNSKVYFNHFLKVHEQTLIGTKYLMGLMARGAAVLCANNQPGLDGLIPFLVNGDIIQPDNIGLTILFQVKNDAKFSHIPKIELFDKMDPQSLGVFSDEIPII